MSYLQSHKRDRIAPRESLPASASTHPSTSDEILQRMLQNQPRKALSPQAITQLQRAIGNQATLQLMRERGLTTAQVGGERVQRDKLVEISGGDDAKDFDSTRDKVQAGLGVASSGQWMAGNFRGIGASEVLYIWGHMTPTFIGNVEFTELAKYMVKQGFTTCASIRLIGCNNQDNFNQAPQTLWNALKLKFVEKGLVDAVPPTIYATKGPLHSGVGKDIYALDQWWVGTPTEKEEDLKRDEKTIRKHLSEGGTLEGETIPDLINSLGWYGSQIGHPIEQTLTLENLSKKFEKLRTDTQDSTKRKKPATYPNLKRPVKDGKEGEMEWNPNAWTSYP